MGQSNQSPTPSAPGSKMTILSRQIRILGASGPMRRFDEGLTQIGATFARSPAVAFASALVIARTQTRPGSQVARIGEAANVRTQFSQDNLSDVATNARNSVQLGHGKLGLGQTLVE